jgi:hypothetical protein
MDGSVYQDLPVGICDAGAGFPFAFLGALHILVRDRHERVPSLVDIGEATVLSSYGARRGQRKARTGQRGATGRA